MGNLQPGECAQARLLVDILAELADGNAVEVMPIHAELTTQEAADMLNVSRPHLPKLLESGARPFHKAGKHRRVRFADLMDRAIPGALVTGYEPLMAGLTLPDPGDRHLLAVAIRCQASVIVTFNERDFPADVLYFAQGPVTGVGR